MQEKFVVKGVIKCDCGNPDCKNVDKFYLNDSFDKNTPFPQTPFAATQFDTYEGAKQLVIESFEWTEKRLNEEYVKDVTETVEVAKKGIMFQIEKIFIF